MRKADIDAWRAEGEAGLPKLRQYYAMTKDRPHPVARARLALALAAGDDAAALDEVVGYLTYPPKAGGHFPDLTHRAIQEAIVGIGAPIVDPLLTALAQGKTPEREAIQVLGQIGDCRALDLIMHRALDPSLGEVCVVALMAILERQASSASPDSLDRLAKLQPPRRSERRMRQVSGTRDGEEVSYYGPVTELVDIDASVLRALARRELVRRRGLRP